MQFAPVAAASASAACLPPLIRPVLEFDPMTFASTAAAVTMDDSAESRSQGGECHVGRSPYFSANSLTSLAPLPQVTLSRPFDCHRHCGLLVVAVDLHARRFARVAGNLEGRGNPR